MRAAAMACLCLIGCDTIGTDSTYVDASATPWAEMLSAVNRARAAGQNCGGTYSPSARALVWNERLEVAAANHTVDMASHQYFDHVGTDGSRVGDRTTHAGYAWRAVGENIARGQRNVNEVVADWISSPSHCRNLMDPRFIEMGASEQGQYWTQVFAIGR
ncbi:MAG TPA: CAP domain-containing protein [Rubricoccaceae bacterium]|jgi:uncharacterized protein YkwD